MAANIFDGSTDSNWGTAANWSLNAVPNETDGNVATFDATSPNCTVNSFDRPCNGLNFTGYTNTITMSFNIAVHGSLTLGLDMGVAGSSYLQINAISTMTSNGKVWPNRLNFSTNATFTLADNWSIDGLLHIATDSPTINGFQITASAGLLCNAAAAVLGTTNIILDGTGTVTLPTSTTGFRLNLTINTAGTITFAAATGIYNTGTLTYTAGTVVTTGSTLTCTLATIFACNGITWNNISFSGTKQVISFSMPIIFFFLEYFSNCSKLKDALVFLDPIPLINKSTLTGSLSCVS